MDQRKITAGVFGAVLLIVSLVLYSPLVTASDVIYREYVAHCENASNKSALVLTVTSVSAAVASAGGSSPAITSPAEGDHVTLTTGASGDTCTIPIAGSYTNKAAAGALTLTVNAKTEDGTAITVTRTHATATTGTTAQTVAAAATNVSGWTSQTPSGVLQTFSSINTLLVSLLPLVIIIGFLGTAAAGLYNYAMSTAGSLQSAIKTEIITLIVALVVIYLMPVVLDQLTDASTTTDGRLSVTGSFKSIIDLIFGIMPIALTIGIFGLVTYRGVQTFRGKGGAMGGGMM